MSARIVIAGGGLAAQRCCETLRRSGHDGSVTVVCGEPTAPYDRPPLSKEVLAGRLAPEAIALRPTDWYAQHGVELLLGTPADTLHAGRHELTLRNGVVLGYDRLLIATGAQPRRLALFDGAPNTHVLRTVADARRLRSSLTPGARLIVVGGGFIGQEVAATARGLGVEVTLLEAMDAPLVGLLGHELGTWIADLHRDHGVDVHCGVTAVDTTRDADGRISGVVTGEGRTLPCDLVLVGVGVAPADGWLAGSGIGGDGVECDEAGRTGLPDVFAAGDVARPYDHFAGAHARSEHWEAAARQGATAARAMLGLDPLAAPLASFWSDQYGLRIQYLGYAALGDAVEFDGDVGARDFSAVWRRDGRPVAGLLVARPRELPAMRRLVQSTLDHHAQEITT
jgi:3-phenylpropionate/trans-cinnamate dioxygenase ferredoxin reductase component